MSICRAQIPILLWTRPFTSQTVPVAETLLGIPVPQTRLLNGMDLAPLKLSIGVHNVFEIEELTSKTGD